MIYHESHSFHPPVRKGSDNAAKQSTHKVVSAAKALSSLQDLISGVVLTAAQSGIALHHAAGGSGGGAGEPLHTASKHAVPASALVGEPVPSELVRPSAWHAKNTLVRNALREIQSKQSQQEIREKAAAMAAAAAVASAAAGDKMTVAAALVAAAATSLPLAPAAGNSLVRSPVKHTPSHDRPTKSRRMCDSENRMP